MTTHMPATVVALNDRRRPLHQASLRELFALVRAGDDRARQALILRLNVMEAELLLEEAEEIEIEFST